MISKRILLKLDFHPSGNSQWHSYWIIYNVFQNALESLNWIDRCPSLHRFVLPFAIACWLFHLKFCDLHNEPLKCELQSAVSGLNRGLAANEDDLRKADEAAKELESVAGPVDVQAEIDKLQGRWKLIYSSAFSSRTLGGSRPGPPTGRLLPITLGQVRNMWIDAITNT